MWWPQGVLGGGVGLYMFDFLYRADGLRFPNSI